MKGYRAEEEKFPRKEGHDGFRGMKHARHFTASLTRKLSSWTVLFITGKFEQAEVRAVWQLIMTKMDEAPGPNRAANSGIN